MMMYVKCVVIVVVVVLQFSFLMLLAVHMMCVILLTNLPIMFIQNLSLRGPSTLLSKQMDTLAHV